ncbi:T9SS type A sorting domain-containing protein [Rasiella sp. SM2506]|uniref:T9SS type A sorting domain-containing protein n=1 Tax=Rasiella sp. SM2506 TaxID=3423914 RepID=UPI003D7BA3A0
MKYLLFILAFYGFTNAQTVDPDFFNQTWYLYEIYDSDFNETFFVEGYQPYAGNPEIEQITPNIFIDETLAFNGLGICNTISGTLEQDPITGDFRTVSTTSTSNACGFFEDTDELYIFGPFAFVDPDQTLSTIINPSITTDSDGFQTMRFSTQPFVSYTYRNSPILTINDFNTSSITVFPNPVENVLHIQSEGQPITSFRIFSNTGTVLLESSIPSSENSLDASQFPAGIYFLQVHSQNGKESFKIIKK